MSEGARASLKLAAAAALATLLWIGWEIWQGGVAGDRAEDIADREGV